MKTSLILGVIMIEMGLQNAKDVTFENNVEIVNLSDRISVLFGGDLELINLLAK